MNRDIISWLKTKQQEAEMEVEAYKDVIAIIEDSNELQKYKAYKDFRTPRKIKITAIYGDCRCPTCNYILYRKGTDRYKCETPFCPHCGQALDWSEV